MGTGRHKQTRTGVDKYTNRNKERTLSLNSAIVAKHIFERVYKGVKETDRTCAMDGKICNIYFFKFWLLAWSVFSLERFADGFVRFQRFSSPVFECEGIF